MAGIREIAKRAKVSISTVSYALNGSDKVSKKTRDRVIKIADDLNYTPNLAGQTLKKQKTNIIGVYVSDFGGYFYSHIIDGISKKLKEFGYETIICSGGKKARLFLPQKLVDGAIIIDPRFPDDDIEKYAMQGRRIVLLRAGASKGLVSHVLVDNKKGSYSAIDRLSIFKKQTIILVTGPSDSFDSQQRLQFSLERLAHHNILNYRIFKSDFTIDGGKSVAQEILKNGFKQASIFSFNDEMAIGIYDIFKQNHVDLSKFNIVGFDNDEISSYLVPSLSSINYSKHHWGQVAAESLLEMINGGKVSDKIINTEFLERGSTSKD